MRSLSRVSSASTSKSLSSTSMFLLPAMWPWAYSSGVRTSRRCTVVSAMRSANSSTLTDLNPLSEVHEKNSEQRGRRLKIFFIVLCVCLFACVCVRKFNKTIH